MFGLANHPELTNISITLFYHSPSKGWQRGRLVTLHKQPCGVTLAMRSLKSNHLIKNGDPNLSSFVGRSQHPTPSQRSENPAAAFAFDGGVGSLCSKHCLQCYHGGVSR
jgi:hypothetical protein